MLKIGFLGAGKMAQALAKGFLAAGESKIRFVIRYDNLDTNLFTVCISGCRVFRVGLAKGEDITASCAPQDTQCVDVFKVSYKRIV